MSHVMRLALPGFRESHETDVPRIMRNGIRKRRLTCGVVAVSRIERETRGL